MYNFLLYTKENRTVTITINRPEVYNSFNDELSFEFIAALKAAKKDKEVRAVVITGAGEKAFCTGQDLKAIKDSKDRSLGESVKNRYNPMIKAMRTMPKPIICRLNGVAAGAGCSLALACDMIVASEKATLIEVFINVGLVMDSGSSFFLPKLVGYNKAFELATLGSKVTAQEAKDLGIIYKVTSPENLDEEVNKLTSYYENAAPKAISMMKAMLNKGLTDDLNSMLDYEEYCQEIAGNSKDYAEGKLAFIEKRKAVYTGE